jgi:hypothetical protein
VTGKWKESSARPRPCTVTREEARMPGISTAEFVDRVAAILPDRQAGEVRESLAARFPSAAALATACSTATARR